MTYSIVDALPHHIGPLAAAMSAPAEALRQVGTTPRKALRRLYALSCYRRAAILDGRPAALWGLTGTLLDDEGDAWLVLSDAARAFPQAVVREARHEMRAMLGLRRVVRSSVLCCDARALRFAQFLGFETGERMTEPTEHFAMVLRG